LNHHPSIEQHTLADRYGLDVFQVLTGQAWGL
jgi:hypothetical protein